MSAKIGESLENSWDKFTRDLKTEINEIGRLSCFSKLKKEVGGPNSEAYASSSCPGSCVEGCPGCGLRGQNGFPGEDKGRLRRLEGASPESAPSPMVA